MCGISGEVNFSEAGPDMQAIHAMNAAMALRGPDGEGSWASGHVVLGNRRLAVLDLERGRQPMVHETALGAVALTFAGEVYNYRELRAELRGYGHYFDTDSDTEAVLNAYVQWGPDAIRRLRGMFGLAIWDGRKDSLLLARDPFGVKPLYYSPTQDGVIFASEPKAIFAHPHVRPSIGVSGWQSHFTVTDPDIGLWQGIQNVRRGTLVTVNNGGIREQEYWSLKSEAHRDNEQVTVQKTREHLEKSVHEQLAADVPLGVLLGGLDSSTLTGVASRSGIRGDKLPTFTVDYSDFSDQLSTEHMSQTSRDTPYAEEVAQMWGTDHSCVLIDSASLASRELRERVVRARDLMAGIGTRATHASQLLLYETVRDRCKVALSGEMADELFGGYRVFSSPVVQQCEGWPWHIYFSEMYSQWYATLNPGFRAALDLDTYWADTYADAVRHIERIKGESAQDHRFREISYLSIMNRAGYLLHYADRLSSAVGLELRPSFCDPRLITYAHNAPQSIKASDGPKTLLKRAVHDLVPSAVLERPKTSYPIAPGAAYLSELQRQLWELLARPASPVFEIMDRAWLAAVAKKPIGALTLIEYESINHSLDLDVLFELYNPRMV